MTERLKEVNRALVEDPTPAECDRAITIRFREVIADYQSPRQYYPSDSDDGYGDSSDIIYDAEEEEETENGLTQESLGSGNLSVINLVSQDSPLDVSSDVHHNNNNNNRNEVRKNELPEVKISELTTDVKRNELNIRLYGSDVDEDTRADVPKLLLQNDDQAEVNTNTTKKSTETTSEKSNGTQAIPHEESLLKVDETGLADLESFLRDCENLSAEEPPEAYYSIENHDKEIKEEQEEACPPEVSERTQMTQGVTSSEDTTNNAEKLKASDDDDDDDDPGGERREDNDTSDTIDHKLPAKSESDYLSLEYSDDFEEFPDEDEVGFGDEMEESCTEKPKSNPSLPTSPSESKDKSKSNSGLPTTPTKSKDKTKSNSSLPTSPSKSKDKTKSNSSIPTTPEHHDQNKTEVVGSGGPATRQDDQTQRPSTTRSPSPQKGSHRSRRDVDSSRRSVSSPTSDRNGSNNSSRNSNKRADSKSPSLSSSSSSTTATNPPKPLVSTTAVRSSKPNNKRATAAPPMIKPALLTPDKLGSIKCSEQPHRHHNSHHHHQHKTRTLPSSVRNSPSSSGGSITSSSVSSSSSSSPSSSASSSSSLGSRGRSSSSRLALSGPVRPTVHSPTTTGRVPGSPVKSSSSAALQYHTTTSTHKATPQPRVRKAASASDLHNRVREDSEERQQINDEVFKAWVKRKDRQAAVTKRQHKSSGSTGGRGGGGGGKSSGEVSERRARAEEAFQAWLSRKREQLKLEKRLRGERRRLEDQNRYARSKAECDSAYREWCRRKRDEVRITARSGGGVPRSQSLERPWVQEKTRKLYSAYLNAH
ncbi:hypothetical protein Pmani_006304 [Petrolisthes manimaculis]|uniref:Coiled-coil domain-containing protein 181 n=1 Tax=Petrolisthes manimaculis TaxID=1843537 RepID=A0AAE1QA40_9EUCA|nr:hypothetical protein Pmani_006304 [Petrolisthes manimaculis]